LAHFPVAYIFEFDLVLDFVPIVQFAFFMLLVFVLYLTFLDFVTDHCASLLPSEVAREDSALWQGYVGTFFEKADFISLFRN
jgi:hypothetical protein